jgi:hypothetical protein
MRKWVERRKHTCSHTKAFAVNLFSSCTLSLRSAQSGSCKWRQSVRKLTVDRGLNHVTLGGSERLNKTYVVLLRQQVGDVVQHRLRLTAGMGWCFCEKSGSWRSAQSEKKLAEISNNHGALVQGVVFEVGVVEIRVHIEAHFAALVEIDRSGKCCREMEK